MLDAAVQFTSPTLPSSIGRSVAGGACSAICSAWRIRSRSRDTQSASSDDRSDRKSVTGSRIS